MYFDSIIEGHVEKNIDKFQPESSSSVRLDKPNRGDLFCCFHFINFDFVRLKLMQHSSNT